LASIGIKIFYFDEMDKTLEKIKAENIERVDVKQDDILEIMYTSGTTGEPKGVILTHDNVLAGVNSTVKSVPLNLKLKMLNLLPLSHIFGQIEGIFLPLYFSYQTYFLDTIQPRRIVNFIRNKRINLAIVVPGILAALRKELKGKLFTLYLGPQFRMFGVGGATLDPELERWWKRRLIKVVQGYGLTETASIVSVNRLLWTKTGSVGRVSEGVEVKIKDDGEILVKGRNVMPGYYKNEAKTKLAFEEDWFKTGDVGEIKSGYLYIRDRKKDIIITESGLNVYPVDIENILNNIDEVKESCIIERSGRIHAVLMLNKEIDPSIIIEKANKKLLTHQKISSHSIWTDKDFPRSSTGKIKKYVVREEISKTKGKEYSYEDKLYSLINIVLRPGKEISKDTKLSDIGMDSLRRIELISQIEKEFGVDIDEAKLDQNAKVSDVERLMEESVVQRAYFESWQLNPIVKALRFLYQKAFYYLIMWPFSRTVYYGLENIRHLKKPVIFVSNHESAWDVHIIINKLGSKIATAAGADILYGIGNGHPLLKLYKKMQGFYVTTFYNCYPFGASIGTSTSLDLTGEFLDKGQSILIFPEGARTLDGSIQNFLPGVGYMAQYMDVPIVPVKIKGLLKILPIDHFIPKFGKCFVVFGKPINTKNMSYIEATKLIEKKVKEL